MPKRVFDKVEENMSHSSEPVRMMKSQVPKKASKKLSIVLGLVIGVLIIVAIVCFGLAHKEKREDSEIVNMWDDVKTVATPSSPVSSETSVKKDDTVQGVVNDEGELSEEYIAAHEAYSENPMARVIDWDALQKINSDVMAWIYIPKIGLDYPILQEQEFGKSFYLTHNIYKVAQKSGAIFTPKEQADTDVDMHMLVYGHHMKNGSMFGILTHYKDKEFCAKHPYIYVYYPDRTEKWGIWTMEHVKDDDMVYLIPYTYDTVEYDELLRYLEDSSMYKTDNFGVDSKTKTMTLSTCDHSGDRSGLGRFIVNAVLLDSVTPGTDNKLSTPRQELPEQLNVNVEITEDDDYEGYTVNDSDTINENVVDDGEVVQFESN